MNRFPIDDHTADRLLAGTLSPEDAPPSYAGLARMIQAATGPATAAELAAEAAVVAAGVEAVRSGPHAPIPRRKSVLTKLLSAKVAGIAAGVVLGATTAAAAATGNLPSSAQTAVSDAVSHVGVSLPSGSSGTNTSTSGTNQSSNKPTTNAAADNPNAQFGLCTAFLAGSPANDLGTSGEPLTSGQPLTGKYAATPFAALITAHGGVTGTTTYCKGVVAAHTSNDSADNGTSSEPTGKPADAGKSSDHSKANTQDSGATDKSGDSTDSTSNGGNSHSGSGNAGSHSDGGSSHRP